MEVPTSLTGRHLQLIQILELESGVHAALKWISGRPIRFHLLTLPILALFQDNISVKIQNPAVTMLLVIDSTVSAIRMVAT